MPATCLSIGAAPRPGIKSVRIVLICLLLTVSSAADQEASAQENAKIWDQGDFSLRYHSGQNDEERDVEDFLRSYGDLGTLVNDLNQEINLKQDVSIVFGPWSAITGLPEDLPNAGYNCKTNEIVVTYALIVAVRDVFADNEDFDYDDYDAEFDYKVFPNVVQTLLHEIGHALIYVNHILPEECPHQRSPTEQRQMEMAADALAFYIMSELYDNEQELVPVATHYEYRRRGSDRTSTHPDDVQRADNYLCWMYGKWNLLDQNSLDNPGEWENCEDMYLDLATAWDNLLGPSLKDF